MIVEEAEEDTVEQQLLPQNLEDDIFEEIEQIEQEEMELQSIPQQNVIIAQVPDNAKFFANSSQVYEIQFIEIPLMSTVVEQSWRVAGRKRRGVKGIMTHLLVEPSKRPQFLIFFVQCLSYD